MAKLLKSKAKGHWDKKIYRGGKGCSCKTIGECIVVEKAELDAIGWDNIMHFPVADGKALYKVVKEKPFTLQHIPHGDAYQVQPALIRGLRLSDLENQRKQDSMWSNLSAHRKLVNVGD